MFNNIGTKARGFSLFEVIVSLSILSFLMLGIARVQVSVDSQKQLSQNYSRAVLQANNMAEEIEACNQYRACSVELTDWNKANKRLLPRGKGCVEGNSRVRINWGEEGAIETTVVTDARRVG
jgi:prepilin-type N-terminal cleavage/methylation domain-containing protein